MAPRKYNARNVRFEIEDFLNPGTWVPIAPGSGSSEGGLNTFTISRDYEEADTTNFGSDGQAEGQNMQIAVEISLEGWRLEDPDTGALDPGQALVEAQAERLGNDSTCGFRFASPGATSWKVWENAYFQLGDEGGETNEKVTWAVTVKRSGPTTTAAIS
ncbi:phage tail tube protein [Streptomyces sp. NPDC086023]|uniref:phage tail tube protein n=1 Tax=Streptomyces sp. NPDC086023 TaxID=3365746 RepID=UPI0037D827AC